MDVESSRTCVDAPVPALGTVLCAADASPSAAAVIYAAAGLAANPGSRLVIVRADHDTEANRLALTQLAQETIPGWLGYRQKTDLQLRSGSPARVVLSAAEECGANLIVMGAHSRGPLARMLSGSVTGAVLTKTTVPVAIVPPAGLDLISLTDRRAVPRFGSVLVPVDPGQGSASQLSFASMLSLASEREITLLHVIPPNADSAEPLEQLKEMARRVDAPGGVRAIVTHGPLVHVISDRQLRCGAGVIVLGRDGGSPGRVARQLLHRTRAVVVFVP